MSNVAEMSVVATPLLKRLGMFNSFYVKDLRALPEDQLFVSPGGVARSPLAITGEVIGLCYFAAKTLRGETVVVASEEDSGVDLTSCDSADKLVSAFEAATQELSAAIAQAPEDIWAKEITPPWQMPDTVQSVVDMIIFNIGYHDGQLNTYQCLLGDEKVHWMD